MDEKIRQKTLRFSFFDGVGASAMVGFTQDYLAPFLLVLGATTTHIGMLNALPNLAASLAQLKSADLAERLKSRKNMITVFALLQGCMLVPMAVMAALGIARPFFFIMLVVLFTSCGAFLVPAWGSLMSDIIPKDRRGEYFGWRNRTLGFVAVGAAFAAGFILNIMKGHNIFYGFAVIFGCAFFFRVASWYFLKRMDEPRLDYNREHHFTFFEFLARMKKSNFAKFVLFAAAMSFSVNIASPFFVVLMLKDLHFSYLLYTVVTTTAILVVYLAIGRWGRHADRVGNLKIIRLTAPFVGFIPLLWVMNRSPLFLIAAQVFSGFVWAGFNLCAANFIYDSATPEKRVRCIAYFNVLNGAALCLGAILGGFILKWLPPVFGHKILALFLISAALRAAVGVFMPRALKEVRPVERVSSNELFFSVIGIKPLLGVDRKTLRF